jgi:hypothetical protein
MIGETSSHVDRTSITRHNESRLCLLVCANRGLVVEGRFLDLEVAAHDSTGVLLALTLQAAFQRVSCR